jgi:long-chain acyl-CoA synthetase
MIAKTLTDLWTQVQISSRRQYLVTLDETFTYRDLKDVILAWLVEFDSLGLSEGDRILIRVDDEPAAVFCFLAALLDGLTPVLLASDTPDLRLLAVHKVIEPSAVVIDDRAELPSQSIDKERCLPPRPKGFSSSRSWRGWFNFLSKDASDVHRDLGRTIPRLPPDLSGLAYIIFTSGTTSEPSGVMISRKNLLSNLTTLSNVFRYSESSRIFNDMVLAHADGMVQGPLLALTNGCAVIRSGGFKLPQIEQWLERIRQERATHILAVPTVWRLIASHAKHDDYFDSQECQVLCSVAASLPDDLISEIRSRFKRSLYNQYGLTETVASALYAGPSSEMGRRNTIGKPIDCEARIDPASNIRNEGELQLRGQNIFVGYWRNPKLTSHSFTPDGWLRTGDMVRFYPTEQDYQFLGRQKTVIMMGGFLIQPEEIDEALLAHPEVQECATVGIEDEIFGEVPATLIVANSNIEISCLAQYLRKRLELRKVPKYFFIVSSIPRGAAGKPQVSQVRSRIKELLKPKVSLLTPLLDLQQDVLRVAADVFQLPLESLSTSSGPDSVLSWDSFAHLSFILALEQRFKVRFPAQRIVTIRSIADAILAVQDLKP